MSTPLGPLQVHGNYVGVPRSVRENVQLGVSLGEKVLEKRMSVQQARTRTKVQLLTSGITGMQPVVLHGQRPHHGQSGVFSPEVDQMPN